MVRHWFNSLECGGPAPLSSVHPVERGSAIPKRRRPPHSKEFMLYGKLNLHQVFANDNSTAKVLAHSFHPLFVSY